MVEWLNNFVSSITGILFLLLCLLGIILGIALTYLIIYGALLVSYKYAECKTMDTLSTADMVKCLMTNGVYYESTLSEEPLYFGEKPTLSMESDKNMDFNKLYFLLKIQGHRDWADDLKVKRENLRKEQKIA